MKYRFFIALGVSAVVGVSSSLIAQEPGWSRSIITLGPEAEVLQQYDPRFRPYRPFHFYGNTLRRAYYRGNPLPTLGDFGAGLQAVLPTPAGPPPPPPLSF